MKNEKQGIISVKLSTGWEPWGIGTFMDGIAAQRDSVATAFAFCPLTLRKEEKAGCAAGKRIPPQEFTTAACESAAPKSNPPEDGGSAASAGRSPVPPRAGGVSGTPKVSEPPTTAELYDFAEAARLNEADAREWWELCTERGWKDRYGNPIRNWKAACERYCAKMAANRLAAATRVE